MKLINDSENPLIEICIPSAFRIIPVRTILFIKAENKGSIFTINIEAKTEIKTCDSLVVCETLLSNLGFFRANKKFLINFIFINCYCKDQVVLHGNYRIPLSRIYYNNFRDRYIEFMKTHPDYTGLYI